MPIPTQSNDRKNALVRGMVAATLAALIGIFSTGIAAASASPSWSVFVHIEYPNGFVYEHAFATGVSTADLPSMLEECAVAHMYGVGSWLQFRCFPSPE